MTEDVTLSEPGLETVIVTGGSRGIGAATCRRLARDGAAIVVNYASRADAAQAVVDVIKAAGGQAIAVRGDMSIEADIVALFDTAQGAFGRPLTGVVNNAGILDTMMPLAEMSADRIARVMALNVTGAMLVAREAVRRMARGSKVTAGFGGEGGSVVNVSSRASTMGSPHEFIDYAASKGAIDTLTIGLAKEVAGDGIRVNAVRPGLIATDIHASGGEPGRADRLAANVPLGRVGTPEEVAELIAWLMSPAARYVTGALVDVSGGR